MLNPPAINPSFAYVTSLLVTYNNGVITLFNRHYNGQNAETSDRGHGVAIQDGNPISDDLDWTVDATTGPLSITFQSKGGLFSVAEPRWIPDCFPATIVALGRFYPMDYTDSAGTTPQHRDIYWDSVVPQGASCAEKVTATVEVLRLEDGSPQPVLRIEHAPCTHTILLRGKQAQLGLYVTDKLCGEIEIPAWGMLPATTLKLN